jgi:cytochrome P450
LLAIHDENPSALTHEEISSIVYELTFAGHETTNCLIGNLVYRLLEKPERWDAVVADPGLIPNAVDEKLRYDPPIQGVAARVQAGRDPGGSGFTGRCKGVPLAPRIRARCLGLTGTRNFQS